MKSMLDIIAAAILSFFFTLGIVPIFTYFQKLAGIVGIDVMKDIQRYRVAEMGGPGVLAGFLAGVFFYIGSTIFLYGELPDLIYILATISTVLLITLIGIFDVLTTLMEEREGKGTFEILKRRGIPWWLYFFIPLPAAVPLAAVKAGVSIKVLPFIGQIDLGIWYPLVLIPIAVVCCSNATNMLAGFNGLEAGMGFVLLSSLGFYTLMHEQYAAALIALTFAASLLAFLRYNWYRAKVFPGDLNYTIGAVCVCVAVLGNMEVFAIVCFMPWIIESFLKLASRFRAESYGVLQRGDIVKPRTKSIRSLTHIVMRAGDFKERQVTEILIAFEVLVCMVAFLLR